MANENIERIVNRRFRMTDNWRIDQIKDLYTTFSPNGSYTIEQSIVTMVRTMEYATK